MTIDETLAYAKRVAFSMYKDPEAESLAGQAAWRAFRTFDDSKKVPYKRWIARCVREDIWGYWRKLKVRPMERLGEAEVEVPESPHDDSELLVSTLDFQLLYEKYIEKWPMDVIAKRHGLSVHYAKQFVSIAQQRFIAEYSDKLRNIE